MNLHDAQQARRDRGECLAEGKSVTALIVKKAWSSYQLPVSLKGAKMESIRSDHVLISLGKKRYKVSYIARGNFVTFGKATEIKSEVTT